jgi:hypothetical protein
MTVSLRRTKQINSSSINKLIGSVTKILNKTNTHFLLIGHAIQKPANIFVETAQESSKDHHYSDGEIRTI